jgi:hypothetical protein
LLIDVDWIKGRGRNNGWNTDLVGNDHGLDRMVPSPETGEGEESENTGGEDAGWEDASGEFNGNRKGTLGTSRQVWSRLKGKIGESQYSL